MVGDRVINVATAWRIDVEGGPTGGRGEFDAILVIGWIDFIRIDRVDRIDPSAIFYRTVVAKQGFALGGKDTYGTEKTK